MDNVQVASNRPPVVAAIRWVPNWRLILAVWLAVGSWVFLAVVARVIWLAVS